MCVSAFRNKFSARRCGISRGQCDFHLVVGAVRKEGVAVAVIHALVKTFVRAHAGLRIEVSKVDGVLGNTCAVVGNGKRQRVIYGYLHALTALQRMAQLCAQNVLVLAAHLPAFAAVYRIYLHIAVARALVVGLAGQLVGYGAVERALAVCVAVQIELYAVGVRAVVYIVYGALRRKRPLALVVFGRNAVTRSVVMSAGRRGQNGSHSHGRQNYCN